MHNQSFRRLRVVNRSLHHSTLIFGVADTCTAVIGRIISLC